MKHCCRVCGKTVEQNKKKNESAVHSRWPEGQHHLGLTITEDFSEFACKKCITNLDKLTRMQTQSEQLRTELVNALMKTMRHRCALRWGLKEHSGVDATAQPPFQLHVCR